VGNWLDQIKFQEMYFCDVINIPNFSYFDIDVELCRRNLGFEDGNHRPSLIEASTRGEN